MAVVTNKNTSQTPMSTNGVTGSQLLKFINASRVYIKAKDDTPAPVTAKSNGSTPSGWTDLGILNAPARVAYEKELFELRTGLDQVLRAQFVRQRTGTMEFVLTQFDDVVLTNLTGLTASQISAGSIYQFAVGSEDVVEKALLLVGQDKLTGKEWQWYNPAGQLSFTYEEDGEATVVRASANCPAFSWGSKDTLFVQSIFA